ncbi:AaceriAAR135Wp [[Ashbya] aceris (nom. inval.)]|nr:AaceriAAR135Wp [[Ashbya] aceris (nom. inval.)]
MSDDSVDIVFEKAIATIQTLSSVKGYHALPRPPASTRIQLYALFKQSTEGDVERILPRPQGNPNVPEFNIALKKWETWKSKEGMSSTEAKKRYIQLLINTMKTYAMGTLAARELLSELEFLWWQVSRNKDDGSEVISDSHAESESMVLLSRGDRLDPQTLRMKEEIYYALLKERNSHFGLLKGRALARREDDKPEPDITDRVRRRLVWLMGAIVRHAWKLLRRLAQCLLVAAAVFVLGRLSTGGRPLKLVFKPASPAPRTSLFSYVGHAVLWAFQLLNGRLGRYQLHTLYIKLE